MSTWGDGLSSALFVALAAIFCCTCFLSENTSIRLFPGLSKSQLANANDPTKMRGAGVESLPGSLVRQAIESWKHSAESQKETA